MITSKKIKIGNRLVGKEEPTYFIAEIGINHNGDINLASKMVAVAAETGVDAVKFQVYKTEQLVSKSSPSFSVLKRCELGVDDVRLLSKEAKDKKITFLATPFDEGSMDLLASLNVPAIKIASGDLTHIPLLRHVSRYKKPIIISTGAATLGEIDIAVRNILKNWNKAQIALLHCVPHYPAEPDEINLRIIKTMYEQFQMPIGYSDHSLGTVVPLTAVACGACIIEKHFTLDKGMKGPDHKSSCNPDELQRMVSDIRIVEKSLGDRTKTPVESEKTRIAIRRSLIAARDIPKKTILTSDMFNIKRPANGISPMEIDAVIGRTATRDIHKDETIEWEMV